MRESVWATNHDFLFTQNPITIQSRFLDWARKRSFSLGTIRRGVKSPSREGGRERGKDRAKEKAGEQASDKTRERAIGKNTIYGLSHFLTKREILVRPRSCVS